MTVVARTRQRDHVLQGQGTLMARCLAAGIPVASACSGRGACGRCVLSILQGESALEAPSDHERRVLARNGAEAGQRLSCQCQVLNGTTDLLVTAGYW